MITWIQKYFQQHFRVIFALLLVIVIVSFIFTIGASPGLSHSDREQINRPFFDLNLASAPDAQRIYGDAQLSLLVNYGIPQVQEEQLRKFGEERYAGIAMANALHLPKPNAEQVAEYVKTLRQFQGQDGKFDAEGYEQFRTAIRTGGRYREADIFRVLSDDYRGDMVRKLFAGPGYILPADVRKQLAETHTEWSLNVATIPYASFKPLLSPTEETIKEYYTQNSFKYETPPRFKGSYVSFNSADYAAKVTITDEELLKYYKTNKGRFTPAPKAGESAPDELAAFATAKNQVEAALRAEKAQRLALSDATEITIQLDNHQPDASTLPSLLKQYNLQAKPLTPFVRGQSPVELGASNEVSAEAFKLGASRLFSDALSVKAGAVILIWEETLPSSAPELASVLQRVTEDYLADERRSRFAKLGPILKSGIEASMKSGASFETAAQTAAKAQGITVEITKPAAFTRRAPAKELARAVLGSLDALEKGAVSEMRMEGDKAIIVYAADKKEPEVDSTSEEFQQTQQRLASIAAQLAGNSTLQEIVEQEQAKSTAAQP